MSFIQLSDISLAFADRDILNKVHFNLQTGNKIAIAGTNGSGKSTLLKILGGLISPDSGNRSISPETRVGYLPQHGIIHSGKTLREEVDTAFEYYHDLDNERIHIEEEISKKEQNDPNIDKLLEKHHQILEKLNNSDYFNRTRFIDTVCRGLGFSNTDLSKMTDTFSGGWQMRIALSKILLSSPDFILLDEPTNYLDIEARNWLESFLAAYSGGFCIVSHDRFFLDATVTEVVEIFLGKTKNYPGNYSNFERARQMRILQLEKDYAQQQEEIKKLNDFIARFRYNQSKAPQVQSRIKMLEKIVLIEIPPGYKKLSIKFPSPPHSGKHVINLSNIRKVYGSHTVLNGLSLEIMRGDKIVLSGANGAGKSTLMRILVGMDTDFTGELRYGTDVSTGYFAQDFEREIKGEISVIEYFEQKCPTHLIPKIRDLLGSFLFQGDDVYKPLDVLSGGEKSRIALLSLLLSPVNLLILDEPTNHLDLLSKDVLLEALSAYSGTVVFVSHDRDFIERLATKVYNLGESPPKLYPGNYSYFLSQQDAIEDSIAVQEKSNNNEITSTQLSRDERKKMKMRLRKLMDREDEILKLTENLEQEKSVLLEKLSSPSVYSDGDKVKKYNSQLLSIENEESDLNEEWTTIDEELTLLKEIIPDG